VPGAATQELALYAPDNGFSLAFTMCVLAVFAFALLSPIGLHRVPQQSHSRKEPMEETAIDRVQVTRAPFDLGKVLTGKLHPDAETLNVARGNKSPGSGLTPLRCWESP
jgi:hypothetical protein